jgi:stage II sporulation protein D
MKEKKYSIGGPPGGLSRLLLALGCLIGSTTHIRTDGAPIVLRIGVARAGGGYAVTTVPLEQYVARVLTGEALPDSRPAALEALAITVRTYALANRVRHAADGFDLCDETHCQVMRMATPATERAAAATDGLVLLDHGVPASVYYSASCGGRTERPSAVWPGAPDPPFLPIERDDACGGAPAWSAELARADLLRSFAAAGFRGTRLLDVRIIDRTSSGRVARLRLEGLQPEEISGPDLRAVVGRTLGWQHIKSTAFDLRQTADGYRFTGHGSGHGVGLCVIGSARLAEGGGTADAILHRYFPGLIIASPGESSARVEVQRPAEPRRAPDPGVRPAAALTVVSAATPRDILITLPAGDEGERESLTAFALSARDDLARRLAVPASPVSLRFHATIDSYERATAQPWFTSGTLVDREIHLLPPVALRDRGILERTVRHELVRLMTDSVLADRPAWVREGAASYFAGQGAGRPGSRSPELAPASCPKDADLLHPISAGALMDASARARACFEREVQAGRPWRDVR